MLSKKYMGLLNVFLFLTAASGLQPVCAEENYFEGIIEPSALVKVSSQVNGILEEVIFDRGDNVKKDEIIAYLNSDIEKAAVDLALARVEFSRRKVLRNEDLYKKQLISIHEKDEMETELEITELQLREAHEKIEIRNIRSPVNGVVVTRFLSRGEYVGEDPVISIAQIDPLYIEVIIPAEEFGKIKKNSYARVEVELPEPGTLKARVSVVDRVIDAASSTFGVRLVLPNPDYKIPAGIKCRVFFPFPE
jgi:RND family efflux transporter MFP subunit